MTPSDSIAATTEVLGALRSLEGKGTLGDIVSKAGLPRDTVETTVKSLLETRKGHLDVSESGELVYRFEPSLIRRDAQPALYRFRKAAGELLKKGFKAWIVVTFVVYFVLFVALVIAAVVAMMSRGDDRRGGWGGRGGGRSGGHFPLGNFWLWYYLWTPRWRLGRPYYGRRWERTLHKDDRAPFYKKVFAFVFGPDRPEPTQAQLDRTKLQLIQARRGVLTSAELIQHTALPLADADEEMGRLVGAYGGEPTVSSEGDVVYAFPELMVSAHGSTKVREPDPAWMRMEYPVEVTGNEKKVDALIAGMAGFNLVAGATAPWFIFPQLGIGGTAAFIGLVLIPVIFSVLFLGAPIVRRANVRRENRARVARNARRVVLDLAYQQALTDGESITVDEAHAHAEAKLGAGVLSRADVEFAMNDLAAEFDADVMSRQDGSLGFRFPAPKRQFLAAETLRRSARLDEQELGETIYSSGDTTDEAHERELAAFDRELAIGDGGLAGYVRAPGRVGFEDDYEVVAFDEELERARALKA